MKYLGLQISLTHSSFISVNTFTDFICMFRISMYLRAHIWLNAITESALVQFEEMENVYYICHIKRSLIALTFKAFTQARSHMSKLSRRRTTLGKRDIFRILPSDRLFGFEYCIRYQMWLEKHWVSEYNPSYLMCNEASKDQFSFEFIAEQSLSSSWCCVFARYFVWLCVLCERLQKTYQHRD